jgi:hypothetical protein
VASFTFSESYKGKMVFGVFCAHPFKKNCVVTRKFASKFQAFGQNSLAFPPNSQIVFFFRPLHTPPPPTPDFILFNAEANEHPPGWRGGFIF